MGEKTVDKLHTALYIVAGSGNMRILRFSEDKALIYW
jgi:hypothetical protein